MSLTDSKSLNLYLLASNTRQATAGFWKDVVSYPLTQNVQGHTEKAGPTLQSETTETGHCGRKACSGDVEASFRETWQLPGGGKTTRRKADTNEQKPTSGGRHCPSHHTKISVLKSHKLLAG